MITKLKRLDFAHIACKASILVSGYPETENITIGCFGYYLKRNGENILVDTGIEDIPTVNLTKSSKDDWQRGKNEFSPEQNMKNINVSEFEIDKVFLTHSHYDHISGVSHYENADIYIAAKEYAYLTGGNPHKKYLSEVIEFLKRKKENGKLILIDDEYEHDGIKCCVTGGHTPGSMLIYIDDCLFTGDNIYLLESIKNNEPIGFCDEPDKAKQVLEHCRKFGGTIFTGHDFKCCKDDKYM